MLINKVEFDELEKKIPTDKSFRDYLAPEMGKTYIIVVTRDGCPACAKQKPKLKKLAETLKERHGDNVVFVEIHVRRLADSDEESLRSKGVLGHYFYPTNIVLVRTSDKGAIEFYRNVSPRMAELKRNVENAIELAKVLRESPE